MRLSGAMLLAGIVREWLALRAVSAPILFARFMRWLTLLVGPAAPAGTY